MPEYAYIGTEVFQRKPFDGIDTKLRAWLYNSEPSRHCRNHTCQRISHNLAILLIPLAWTQFFIYQPFLMLALAYLQKNCLLPPLSSIISTSPGFNCSMEGTWLASTPISPDSAGMLTCTLSICFGSAQALACEGRGLLRSGEGRWATHTSVDLYIDYPNNGVSAIDNIYEDS